MKRLNLEGSKEREGKGNNEGHLIGPRRSATLSGLRRGPESCGSRSRGSGRSSNSCLTRSEIKEALRGATSELVGDLTQEIRAKLEPLIPPQASQLAPLTLVPATR